MSWCRKSKEPSNATLGDDCLFRGVLFIGIGAAICFAFWIILLEKNHLTFCKTSECFSDILVIFKFPISLAVATFTLAGFIAVIFRSKQTAAQIQETIKQNTFKNYLDHKKQFVELLSSLEDEHNIKFLNKNQLYATLFPDNTPTQVSFSPFSDSNNSPLSVWVKNYNKKINELNILNERAVNEFESILIPLAKWLGELTVYLGEAHIHFKDTTVVSESYKHHFVEDDLLNCFPSDLEKSLSHMEGVFFALAKYCLPSEYRVIVILRTTGLSENINLALSAIRRGRTHAIIS